MTSGSAAGAEGSRGIQADPRSMRNEVMGSLKEILGGKTPLDTEPKLEVAEATQMRTEPMNQRGVIV